MSASKHFLDMINQIEPRESVMLLARLMEYKLIKNQLKKGSWPILGYDEEGKRTWYGFSYNYLLKRLDDERLELIDSLQDDGDDEIDSMLECADVANFAMMIVDNLTRTDDHE